VYYKTRHFLYGIFFFLCITIVLLVGIIGYLEWSYVRQERDRNIVESTEWKQLEENQLFLGKSFVFLAPYVKEESILFPMINLNSEEVIAINDDLREAYQTCVSMKQEGHDVRSNYEYTVQNNILSILVVTNIDGVNSYETYAFHLDTSKIASYQTIYQEAGITDQEMMNRVEIAVQNYYTDVSEELSFDREQYVSETMERYTQALEQNTLKYYLGKDKKLSLYLEMRTPGTGEIRYQMVSI